MTIPEARLERKSKATAISNGIGSLHREHYGRGADRIRTVIHPELVATTLEDCFTTVEKRMISEGAFVQVRATRTMFQDELSGMLELLDCAPTREEALSDGDAG